MEDTKEVSKRKAESSQVESTKKRKTDGIQSVKFIAEDHPHFYPVGPIINLFALTSRTNGFTSVELFEIDPLVRLILDYLGKCNTWAISYFDHSSRGCCTYESGVLSIHQTEIVALRDIVTAWCSENLVLMFAQIDDDDHERQDVVKPDEEKRLKTFARDLRNDLRQYSLDTRSDFYAPKWDDRVRQILLQKFDDSRTSEDTLRNIWTWCRRWQDLRTAEDTEQSAARYFTLTEMPLTPLSL